MKQKLRNRSRQRLHAYTFQDKEFDSSKMKERCLLDG